MLHTLPIESLVPHPGNANSMAAPRFRKLRRHIERTGNYPPIIVRPLSGEPGGDGSARHQILDGHHRVRALRELGETVARCDVWQVDDREATILLLTLNRLEGADDPRKRALLIDELRELDEVLIDAEELAKVLPEDGPAIERLRELALPPAMADVEHAVAFDVEPITFFLSARQRGLLLERLSAVGADRTTALLRLLGIGEEDTQAQPALEVRNR